MKNFLLTMMVMFCTACTYNITMAHTEGTASDFIDDNDSTQVTTNATANVPISTGSAATN